MIQYIDLYFISCTLFVPSCCAYPCQTLTFIYLNVSIQAIPVPGFPFYKSKWYFQPHMSISDELDDGIQLICSWDKSGVALAQRGTFWSLMMAINLCNVWNGLEWTFLMELVVIKALAESALLSYVEHFNPFQIDLVWNGLRHHKKNGWISFIYSHRTRFGC